MSGIVGQVSLDGHPADRDLIARMASETPERGPDGTGFWAGEAVVLGHMMLRSTPESASERQPLVLAERDLAIVCDGTLYNREELGGELPLTAGSHRQAQSSHPDSLLILLAYDKWGISCLDRLVGDFAFAIWNGRKRELAAAVDPVGIRQLYYHLGTSSFLFASEERQLLVAPWVSRELDPRVIRSFLAGSFPGDGSTVYRAIKRLPGGHALILRGGRLEVRRYWDPRPRESRLRRDADYVEHFREIFRRAVVSRLRSSGPVACWVSGGLDSSSVASSAAEHLRGPAASSAPRESLHCVTAVFPGLDCDERRYARKVSERYGLPHHFVAVENKGLLDAAIGCLKRQATPYLTTDPVLLETVLSETRRIGCRTCLTGLGGDEVLAPDSILYHLFRRLRWGLWWGELSYVRRPGWRAALRSTLHYLWMTSPDSVRRALGRWRRRQLALLGTGDSAGTVPWWRRAAKADFELDAPVSWMKSPAPGEGLMGNLLAWRDRVFFRHGIEVRSPFLDRRLIEFMLGVPDHLFIGRGFTKIILRRAVADVLPESVMGWRSYAEFSRFFDRGLRDHDGEKLRRMFSGDLASERFLRSAEARCWIDDYLAERYMRRWDLWYVITLELWLRIRRGRAGPTLALTRGVQRIAW